MSTLGFCNLDEAFNNSTIKKKKKSRKSDIDKILQRGSEIDIARNDVDRPGAMPINSTNMDEVNALPFTYDANNKYAKLQEQDNLAEQRARDQEPNEIQHKKNEEAMDFMKQIQTQIRNKKRDAIVIRTLPNLSDKKTRRYSNCTRRV